MRSPNSIIHSNIWKTNKEVECFNEMSSLGRDVAKLFIGQSKQRSQTKCENKGQRY